MCLLGFIIYFSFLEDKNKKFVRNYHDGNNNDSNNNNIVLSLTADDESLITLYLFECLSEKGTNVDLIS